MLELRILSGRSAGEVLPVPQYPFTIGRASSCHCVLQEPGVWEDHAALHLTEDGQILLRVSSKTSATVDGSASSEAILRNGSVIGIGSVRLQCHRSAAALRTDRWRRALLYAICLGTAALQVALMFVFR